MPSTTGDYTFIIIAQDAAGNTTETTVNYSVVISTVPGMPWMPCGTSDFEEIIEVDIVIVPETSTLALTGIGLFRMCLMLYRRKKIEQTNKNPLSCLKQGR